MEDYGSGNENVKAFVKYNTFDKEQTKAWQKQIGRVENMTYYICL